MREREGGNVPTPISGEAGATRAIHARVIPSLMVEALSRPFKTWMGDILPYELVCWTRGAEPPSSVGDDIRLDTMRRLRQRKQNLWEIPTRVRLHDGWERRLERVEVLAVQQVLAAHPGRALHELSLNDFKPVLRKPWDYILALLARIEAHGWVPSAAKPHRRKGWEALRQFSTAPPVQLEAETVELVGCALALPWVSGVAGDDMRLAAPGNVAPAEWMRSQLTQKMVSPHLHEFAQLVCTADGMTYAEEIAALAEVAIHRCDPSPNADNEGRWVKMFVSRFTAPAEPHTLQDIGAEMNLTRERVRQICDSMLQVVIAESAAKPALERVLRMAARAAPLGVAEMNAQLSKHLGAESGIAAVFEFVAALALKDVPVRIGNVKVRQGRRYEDAPIVETTSSGTWPQACLRYAHAECVTLGCTSVIRIAGLLALREGAAPGQESIVSVLLNAPDFRWLDELGGWFSIGDTNNCGAASRLRKILSVARHPVSVDSVAEAYACDTRWFRVEDSRALAVPPTHVIQAMVEGWPWVRITQYTKFSAVEPIPMEVLTGIERLAVSIIEEVDGVAAAWQLYDRLPTEAGVTKMAVSITLASSAILERFEHGLYTLRGRRFKAQALSTAREMLSRRYVGAGGTMDAGEAFRVKVSSAALVNEQYGVPAFLRGKLAGRMFAIEGSSSTVTVSGSGVMRGVNRYFGDLAAGDEFNVQFEGDVVRLARTGEAEA